MSSKLPSSPVRTRKSPNACVMGDALTPRPAYVLLRGQYTDHGEQVTPRGLSQIFPWNDAWPQNRLGLAKWIFDPSAESDDGRFELVPVTGRRDFGTKLLGSLRRSPVGVDDLSLLGFSHAPPVSGAHFDLTVRSTQLPAAQCDGEELPAGERYRIDAVPRALRLIVPRDHVEPGM